MPSSAALVWWSCKRLQKLSSTEPSELPNARTKCFVCGGALSVQFLFLIIDFCSQHSSGRSNFCVTSFNRSRSQAMQIKSVLKHFTELSWFMVDAGLGHTAREHSSTDMPSLEMVVWYYKASAWCLLLANCSARLDSNSGCSEWYLFPMRSQMFPPNVQNSARVFIAPVVSVKEISLVKIYHGSTSVQVKSDSKGWCCTSSKAKINRLYIYVYIWWHKWL